MKLSHWHLSQITLKEARTHFNSQSGNPFSILDIGCGIGELVGEVHNLLMKNEIKAKVEGFEITEHGGQIEKWNQKIVHNLSLVDSQIDWRKRIKLVSSDEGFPYADNSINIALACHFLNMLSIWSNFSLSAFDVCRKMVV